MRKDTIYTIAACAVLLTGIVAQHALARMKYAHPTPLPINTFPRQIGNWKAGKDLPNDPLILEALPGATLVSRDYANVKHPQETVNLMLVTGNSYQDFHDPRGCFPTHGFRVSHLENWVQDGNRIQYMQAEQNGNTIDFLFYVPGGLGFASEQGDLFLRKMFALREMLTGASGGSVVVRLTVDDGPNSQQLMRHFIDVIQPAVTALVAKGKKK